MWSLAALPLVLWAGFSFPYVTIRTVFFRIIIEAALVLALLLFVQGKIRLVNFGKQYFFWIFAGLLTVESIAALLGESPLASFFGDLERMWGIFTVVHLFLFYVLAAALFRQREWRVFFRVSLSVSLAVSAFGIIQRHPEFFQVFLFGAGEGSRIMSTLGNPVYVAIYLLFNIAFALYLAQQPGTSRKARWFYIGTIVLDLYAFTLTDIRGAYLGFLAGAVFAGLGYVFIGSRRMAKRAIAASFVLGIVVLALSVQFRSSDIVQRTPVLRRVASISLSDDTVQTRFIGWNAAWQGFLEHPLTGVGMENYNILFNKYFPARYYLLAPSETYFDRAHNQFFNILAESGIAALLAYLAFPLIIGYYLVAGYRNGRLRKGEFLLFGAMTIAYFTHLFFVFDDLHSLFLFAAFMALLELRCGRLSPPAPDGQESAGRGRKAVRVVASALLPALVIYSIIFLNINVLRAARLSGRALLSEDINQSLNYFRRALGINSVPSENVTLSLVDYLMGLFKKKDEIQKDPSLRENVLAAFWQAEQELAGEIAKKPNDAVFFLKLGQLKNTQFLFDDDARRLEGAKKDLERALELSPGRVQIYLVLGETYVLAGESKKAIEIIEKAVALEPDFGGTYYYLGRAYLADGQLERAYDAIIIEGLGQPRYWPEDDSITFVLAEELGKAGQYEKMTIVYEYLARFQPKNARVFSALAAAYVLSDRPADAIKAAKKAAELDPSFRGEADSFIQAIEEGRIEELKKSVL